MNAPQIRTGIETTLDNLLDGSDNKEKKIILLQTNIVGNQKVKKLKLEDWRDVLIDIVTGIYAYIDDNSSEGQDLLNLFLLPSTNILARLTRNQAFYSPTILLSLHVVSLVWIAILVSLTAHADRVHSLCKEW